MARIRLMLVVLGALLALASAPVDAAAAKKKTKKTKATAAEQQAERRGIDTNLVWRAETEVFSSSDLEKLEPILRASSCADEKTGCLYHENGKPASEASFAFRLIPWKVSRHRGYLVRNDRCGAGGCDEGLFVLVDGQWRLLIEIFGMLRRQPSSTEGFTDLVFYPRGQQAIRLVWDGRAYRTAED